MPHMHEVRAPLGGRGCSLTLVPHRHEMRAPFAAWLCQQASPPTPAEGHFFWDSMRRYVVAPVTRPGKGRGLPAVFMQVGVRLDFPLPYPEIGVRPASPLPSLEVRSLPPLLSPLPDKGLPLPFPVCHSGGSGHCHSFGSECDREAAGRGRGHHLRVPGKASG